MKWLAAVSDRDTTPVKDRVFSQNIWLKVPLLFAVVGHAELFEALTGRRQPWWQVGLVLVIGSVVVPLIGEWIATDATTRRWRQAGWTVAASGALVHLSLDAASRSSPGRCSSAAPRRGSTRASGWGSSSSAPARSSACGWGSSDARRSAACRPRSPGAGGAAAGRPMSSRGMASSAWIAREPLSTRGTRWRRSDAGRSSTTRLCASSSPRALPPREIEGAEPERWLAGEAKARAVCRALHGTDLAILSAFTESGPGPLLAQLVEALSDPGRREALPSTGEELRRLRG